MSPLPVGHTSTTEHVVVRAAISLLCREVLQPLPVQIGTRDSEIEMRMGALAQLERAWEETGVYGEERERKVFTQALRDGYVLCQLMNMLRPGSIDWIDPHEDGILRTSNVTKFLDSCFQACFSNVLLPEDVFLPNDLIDATPESLTRVAKTIMALVTRTEKRPSTHSLPLLQSGGNFKLDEGSRILPPCSRITTDADDDLRHMRARSSDFGLSADGTITHTTRSQSISPPIRSWSASSSRRNQSVSPSTRNLKGSPSMKNQSLSHFSKNRSISPSTKNMSPATSMSASPLSNPSPNPSPLVSISPSIKNMSTPPSPKNQNMSFPPSTSNRPIAPSRMKQFVTPSDIDVSGAHSDLLGVSEYSTGDNSGIQSHRSYAERRIFRIASDRRAGPSDLVPWGAIEGDSDPQSVVVGENMKTWTHIYVQRCIGRGSWGSVYRSINLDTGQTVAVKFMRLVHLKEKHITQIMEEIDMVKQLSHPSIIKYEGMTRDADTLMIVLEYTENESLKEKLRSSGKLSETLVANYVVKILEGLNFLHCNGIGIVHGNLKAASIFTTNVGNVKLSDFGLSLNRLALWGEISNISCAPNWAAPEVIKHTGSSTKSDIWSLGCTVIELLTGHPPYGDIPNVMSVMSRIVMDDYPPIPEHFSRPLTPFLKWCFQKVPVHRPSVRELLEHEWLKSMNKDSQTPDTNTIPHGVNSETSKNDTLQHLTMVPDLVDTSISKPVRPPRMWWHRIRQVFSPPPARRPRISRTLHAEPGPHSVGGHSFVDATFGKAVICRVCMESMREAAALCSRCCLVAHSKCITRAPAGCNT